MTKKELIKRLSEAFNMNEVRVGRAAPSWTYLDEPAYERAKAMRFAIVTFRRGYFYHGGADEDKLAHSVVDKLDKLSIGNRVELGRGDHFHAFVGGAKEWSARSSNLWVVFAIPVE